ncbi:hypothetical protein BRC99_04795 [Halobacteriales archaeon QS_7_69_60]|nr:MAG: hypothetical protein BRC99_04795 [Halobacteriales archaeon QS_7_69_60]
MNGYLDRAVTVTRGVVNGAQSDRITFIAASLAYYALISLLPLLLLALAAAAALGDAGTVEALVDGASGALGEQAGTLVRDGLAGAAGAGGATVLGLAVLLWSGLKLFRGLDVAFSAVYARPGPESLLDQLRNGTVALVAGLIAAFLPLYYVLPGGKVAVREALPGAVFAAVGWTLLQTGFRAYAGAAGSYETYGALGGVLLLVTFLYVGALLLLLGVVLNAVLAGRAAADTGLAEPAEPTLEPTAVLDRTMTQDRPDDLSDEELREELERLYDELDRFEARIDDRTVHREEIESDLKRYVRRQVRRGKARGWGPYLVLLYGTAMTLGAFFYLSGGWAILAMLVVWLSTLGLYALMVLVGTTATLVGVPGRLKDRLESR